MKKVNPFEKYILYTINYAYLFCTVYIGQFINNYLHFIELNDQWKITFLVYFVKMLWKNLKVNFF